MAMARSPFRVVTGGDSNAIAAVLRAGRRGVPDDADALKDELVADLKAELNKPGTGRTYTTNFYTDKQGRVRPVGTRPPHTASAPGQPPAPDSGDLRDSIDGEVVRGMGGPTVEVGTDKEYGPYLEYGTSKMLARPWLRPTVARKVPTVHRPFYKGLSRRMRAMARALGGSG